MRAEIARWCRTARNTVMIGAAAYGIVAPIVNYETTGQVIQAFSGERPDCLRGAEAHNEYYSYSAIAVPGAGAYFNTDTNTYMPNEYGRRRLTAAALAFLAGYAPTVILLDGEAQEDPPHPDASKDYLQQQVTALSHGTARLYDNLLYTDFASINTATNMQALRQYATDHGMSDSKFLIVTDDFHGGRAIMSACANDVDASLLTVEDIFGMYKPSFLAAIDAQGQPPEMNWILAKETIETSMLPWDPNGYVPTLLKQLSLDRQE